MSEEVIKGWMINPHGVRIEHKWHDDDEWHIYNGARSDVMDYVEAKEIVNRCKQSKALLGYDLRIMLLNPIIDVWEEA